MVWGFQWTERRENVRRELRRHIQGPQEQGKEGRKKSQGEEAEMLSNSRFTPGLTCARRVSCGSRGSSSGSGPQQLWLQARLL